jgi:hypothetical protein
MRFQLRLNRRLLAVSGAMALLGATVGVAVGTSGLVGPDKVVHGCYNSDGRLKVISYTAHCQKGWTAIEWNQQGVQGPKGDTGAAGAIGAAGPAGSDGAQGPAGADGPQGPKGDTGAAGAAGTNGLPGAEGAPGAQGPQGEPGAAGPGGPAVPGGPAGAAGANKCTSAQIIHVARFVQTWFIPGDWYYTSLIATDSLPLPDPTNGNATVNCDGTLGPLTVAGGDAGAEPFTIRIMVNGSEATSCSTGLPTGGPWAGTCTTASAIDLHTGDTVNVAIREDTSDVYNNVLWFSATYGQDPIGP